MATNFPRPVRLELMRRAWRLAVEGRPQALIAAELGISQSQVSRYLARTSAKAWERLESDARTYALLSLAQTDTVLAESLRAFERSTRPRKSATKKTSPDGNGKGAPSDGTTTTQVVEREGDPAWLAKVMEAIRLRVELLDRYAPKPATTDETSGAGTVADALLEAERRDEAYSCETDSSPPSNDSPATSPRPTTIPRPSVAG